MFRPDVGTTPEAYDWNRSSRHQGVPGTARRGCWRARSMGATDACCHERGVCRHRVAAGHWSDTATRTRTDVRTSHTAHRPHTARDDRPRVHGTGGRGRVGREHGTHEGVVSALIADRASAALRGTALGLYAPANGVALLVVGTRGGLLWERGGSRAPFWLGAAASVAALLLVRRLAGSDQD
jgi:hypothetical protein